MVLIKLLIFTLTFYQLFVDLDAIKCPKGHKVKSHSESVCVPCHDGSFHPGDNESLFCRPCTKCIEDSWSFEKQACTKETDTKCECRGEFVTWDDLSSTCKCDIGFGLTNGVCSKCKYGHFSKKINSPCQEWKKCESGVKIDGSGTSDVTCNELRINTTSYTKRTPSKQPPEGAHTQNMLATNMTTTTTTPTTASPGHRVTTKPNGKIEPSQNSNTGHHIGTVLILLGIVGLLLLTAVNCKLHNACVQRKPGPTNDSLCRRPVEESGDSSPSTSIKLIPGEP
ncbi:tumor necrosis factor receptor superfamily member 4 [Pleuronectes platessa]|uniref:tumor necrosis factor receptor superfamily member 4 n=1 Tax=Pleuronectes platessa TaxID=8262 RepID=UPI00232A599E|nr:tumor necrosis factor receptor superfamily member 4 [Pleuronectes platessa]